MRTSSILMSITVGVAVAACAPADETAQACPNPDTLTEGMDGVMAHVRFLADDALEGREVASQGERCAAEYIASHFEAAGLQPAGEEGSWMQAFQVRSGSDLAEDNALILAGEERAPGAEWTPFGFSGSSRVEAPMVYAATGLSRDTSGAATPEGSVSVSGKIAVIEAETPGATPGSFQADPHFKASVAQGREAAAVVVLLPEGAELPDMSRERRPFVQVPVVAVRGALADRIREAAQAEETLTLAAAVEPRMGEALNVAALLPGSDPALAGEVVVVGAHFDHLGWGGEGSLDPDAVAIHNGADDNASGTAALLEVASALADGPAPARPVLFLGFSGEEKGLLGSAHYVRNPTVALDEAVAMLNLDMVGRLRENTLTVYGMVTAPEWEGLLRDVNTRSPEPFELALLPDGYGPSDHSSFYGEGIPVLHFFTNTHTDYHRPVDDWDTLNGEGLERITDLVTQVTGAVAGAGTRVAELTPVESEPPAPAGGDEPSGRGYGPYFGSIPDMTPTDFGVRLSGVREGSPAERAGLMAGDVIVRFGDTEVTDLYLRPPGRGPGRPGRGGGGARGPASDLLRGIGGAALRRRAGERRLPAPSLAAHHGPSRFLLPPESCP